MVDALKETHFQFAGQTGFYRGKVRDVYYMGDHLLMVASDRISAFDVILPEPIPLKGQVLNSIASYQLEATKDIVPNWVESCPDPNIAYGKQCEPFKVEMVIRGFLAGHAWREYKSGKREICGVKMPDGMVENQKFPEPIITPTTKASEGHDEDISKQEIIDNGIVSKDHYEKLEFYTKELFNKGSEIAHQRGLILVDTKYEFGLFDDEIILMDEIHTPDSSRYFYQDTYHDLLKKNERQRQLSKEFVREWLISNGFQGKEGQKIPKMTSEVVKSITERYLELYKKITGQDIEISEEKSIDTRMRKNLDKAGFKISN